jgi:H+/Cl- antiporter ClcA
MKVRQFLDVVPKPVKTVAGITLVCAVLIGVASVLMEAMNHGRISVHAVSLPALASYIGRGVGFGLVGGAFCAIWVLCLGYVYADSRRRAMPPVLWTLIAAFIPNLLGFLLYFALRRPIALPCSHCGQAITPEQRFCSWCGSQGSSVLSSQAS